MTISIFKHTSVPCARGDLLRFLICLSVLLIKYCPLQKKASQDSGVENPFKTEFNDTGGEFVALVAALLLVLASFWASCRCRRRHQLISRSCYLWYDRVRSEAEDCFTLALMQPINYTIYLFTCISTLNPLFHNYMLYRLYLCLFVIYQAPAGVCKAGNNAQTLLLRHSINWST